MVKCRIKSGLIFRYIENSSIIKAKSLNGLAPPAIHPNPFVMTPYIHQILCILIFRSYGVYFDALFQHRFDQPHPEVVNVPRSV